MRLQRDDRKGGEAVTEIAAREDAKSDQKQMRRVKHGDRVRERKWEGEEGGVRRDGCVKKSWRKQRIKKGNETGDGERKTDRGWAKRE